MKKKTDRKSILLLVLAFVVTVTLMTWYDLTPHAEEDAQIIPTSRAYLVGEGTPLSRVPNDDQGVVLWLGRFDITQEKTTFAPAQGMSPITFAQRQVDLAITLSTIPDRLSDVFETVKTQSDAWDSAGNVISDIYIFYDTDTPNWKKLNAFTSGLKNYLKSENKINLVVKPTWFKDNKKNLMEVLDIQKTVSYLIFDMADVVTSGQSPHAFVEEAGKIEFPFLLIVDASIDREKLYRDSASKTQFFGGFITAIGKDTK